MPPASWHTSNTCKQGPGSWLRPPVAERFGPNADVAQLAEQLFCKQQVRSSSLLVGSQKTPRMKPISDE